MSDFTSGFWSVFVASATVIGIAACLLLLWVTARKKVVSMLKEQGLLSKVESHVNNVGVHGKCDTDIEPMVSRQWFVKIEPLAKDAIRVVEEGRITFLPENWTKTESFAQ